MSVAVPIIAVAFRRPTGGGIEATRQAVRRHRAQAERRIAHSLATRNNRRNVIPNASIGPTAATVGVEAALRAALPIDAAVLRGFARAVDAAVTGPVILHADRERLIQRARRLGIKRFDANLLIAAVLHGREDDFPAGPADETIETEPPRRGKAFSRVATVVVTALVTQGLLIVGALALLF